MITEIFNLAKEQILSNAVMGAAMWLSIGGALMMSLRKLPATIWDATKKFLIHSVYIDEKDDLFMAFERWLNINHQKKYRVVEATTEEYSGPEDIYDERPKTIHESKSDADNTGKLKLFYKHYTNTFIINYKGRILSITKSREKLENASQLSNRFFNNYTIKGVFSKNIINKLLEEVLFDQNKKIKHSNSLYRNSYDSWSKIGDREFRDLSTIILKSSIKKLLLSSIDDFLKSKKWYNKRGIPYKYGVLMRGPPGNGKTSLIQGITKKYNKNLYYLNLLDADLTDARLFYIFSNIKENSILIIEDIDSVFTKKRTIKNKKVSFSGLLNCLDGVFSKEGLLVIFTTNKKNDLDEALIRPGRIDLEVGIPKPSINEVKEYYKLFFNKTLKITKLKKRWCMAELQKIFFENKENPEKIKDII